MRERSNQRIHLQNVQRSIQRWTLNVASSPLFPFSPFPLVVRRGALLLALSGALSLSAAPVDESKLPPAATQPIHFTRDIKPILEASCLRCHGPEKPKSKFRLDDPMAALAGGENGIDIITNNSAKSPLIHYVARLVPEMEMPPTGRGEPLTAPQIGLLRAWIDQGLPWETNPPPPKLEVTVAPTFGWSTVHGNEAVFREHHWMKEGWNGGYERFELLQRLDERSRLLLEGRALLDDYRISLTLERKDLGFARGGVEQYRKYFSDSGGFERTFTPSLFDAGNDWHLDIGRAWADFGLTLPNWPRMVLGYEYQYRDGVKSTLQWGDVTQGADTRKIYPGFKDVKERTHVVKFDLDHEWAGVRIENTFRGELHQMATDRQNVTAFTIGDPLPSRVDNIREGHRHLQGANALRLERQFNEWLLASGGYLFSKLSGDAAFSLTTFNPAGLPVFPPAFQRLESRSQQITLERQSHVFNANVQLGPWDGFTVSAGAQSEWTRQEGFGTATLDELIPVVGAPPPLAPVPFRADLDKATLEEKVVMRYTKLPFTVLFAEGRLQQESIGQFEEQVGGAQEFVRDTDATSDLRDVRAGFNTSPWRRVSFSAHYRRYEKDSDYDHLQDAAFGAPNEGYSAFIRSREIHSDEIEAKLVVHPLSWVKTTFGYKLVATDFHTTTDPVAGTDPGGAPVPGLNSPGGRVFAGNYNAHVFSVNATLSPWRRCYWSTTLSYQNSRTLTAANDSPSLVSYRGHAYAVVSSANYAWNERTDVGAAYSFSYADFAQDTVADGLAYGADYRLHAVQGGITRKFRKDAIRANLRYGFYYYTEPASGHFNDYTAHALFATVTVKWP